MAAPDFVAPTFCAETITPPRSAHRDVSKAFFANSIVFAEILADFLICSAGALAVFLFCRFLSFNVSPQYSIREFVDMSAAFGFTTVFLMYRDGGYRGSSGLLQIRESARALRIPAQALILMAVVTSLLRMGFTWVAFLINLVLIPILLVGEKRVYYSMAKRLWLGGRHAERTVVYGTRDTTRILASTLLQSPRLWLDPVAVVADDPDLLDGGMLAMGYRGRRAIPLRLGPVTPTLLESLRCDLLLLTVLNLSREQIEAASRSAQQIGLDVALHYGPDIEENCSADSIDVDEVLFTTSRTRQASWLYLVAKRVFDVAISAVFLVLLAPLLLFIGILIRLDSPGPALFVQNRVGHCGQLFNMYKFRSMFIDAPQYALSPQTSNDPRLTRVGRLIRRMSLDELPQLVNVLLGTMSLVGPRPEMPFIVERYDERQRQRLQVCPGITGLWQLSADRAFPIHQNIEYDLYYIRNRSLSMDVAIMLHTLVFALCGGI